MLPCDLLRDGCNIIWRRHKQIRSCWCHSWRTNSGGRDKDPSRKKQNQQTEHQNEAVLLRLSEAFVYHSLWVDMKSQLELQIRFHRGYLWTLTSCRPIQSLDCMPVPKKLVMPCRGPLECADCRTHQSNSLWALWSSKEETLSRLLLQLKQDWGSISCIILSTVH
jgi:hypothetical protein